MGRNGPSTIDAESYQIYEGGAVGARISSGTNNFWDWKAKSVSGFSSTWVEVALDVTVSGTGNWDISIDFAGTPVGSVTGVSTSGQYVITINAPYTAGDLVEVTFTENSGTSEITVNSAEAKISL